jgi:hypothetical protein
MYWEKLAEFTKREKRDRCRDSMEAVLTNGVHYLVFITPP